MRSAVVVAAALIPLQILAGDMHGLNTFAHQPAKIAAIEGVWQDERGAPLLLFAWPDAEQRRNHFEIAVPKGAALILTHDPEGELRGVDDFPNAHPPVAPLFFAFRAMVGTGMLMLAFSWIGLWWYRRCSWQASRLPRPLLWGLTAMTFSGWIATVAGWYVTEVGRQPFIVFGLLRVDEVASKVPSPMIALTLALYVALYLALIAAYVGVVKYMAEKPVGLLATPDALSPAGSHP
jgi:cytochrome d ubiquinol oxidase subunit I